MPNAFADFCFQAWKRKYGHEPPWSQADYAILSKAKKQLQGREDVAELSWATFLANTDEFWKGHEPKMFLARLAKFATYPKRMIVPETDEKLERMREAMREVYADPQYTTEQERRDAWVKILREREKNS